MLSWIALRALRTVLLLLLSGAAAFALSTFAGHRPDVTGVTTRSLSLGYLTYLADAAQGGFGTSVEHARAVGQLIGERLPATLDLLLLTLVEAIGLGLTLGGLAAVWPRGV